MKTIVPASIVVILLWILAFIATPNHITFEDPLLEASVRQSIGKPQGNLTPKDVQNIEMLVVQDSRIEKLGGIEYLSGLKVLDLRRNRIQNIEPLASLTNLVQLNLRENDIQDLKPLQKLTSLKYLNLRNNNVTDISPLKSLTQLEDVNLRYNKIEQVDALANMQHLRKRLYLEGNPIKTLEPIEHYVHQIADTDLLMFAP